MLKKFAFTGSLTTGSVLFDRQCVGSAEHRNPGEPVFTSSPGCSAKISLTWLIFRGDKIHIEEESKEDLLVALYLHYMD